MGDAFPAERSLTSDVPVVTESGNAPSWGHSGVLADPNRHTLPTLRLSSQNGASPLFIAAQTGNLEVMDRLLQAQADVHGIRRVSQHGRAAFRRLYAD